MLVDWLRKLWYGDEDSKGPDEDIHSDPDANIGDERYHIKPHGELFGYDNEHHVKKLELYRQKYKTSGTFHNGKKSYDWQHSKTIFQGTVEEWEEMKANPEKHRESIPVDWDKLVDHMDNFIKMNGEYISKRIST
jgi:hypothetical protein